MGKSPFIKWNIVKKAEAYKGGDYSCRLGLEEKFCLWTCENKLLNKKNELIPKC